MISLLWMTKLGFKLNLHKTDSEPPFYPCDKFFHLIEGYISK